MFGNVAVYIGDKSFEEIINPNCLLYFYSKNEIELEMQKKIFKIVVKNGTRRNGKNKRIM